MNINHIPFDAILVCMANYTKAVVTEAVAAETAYIRGSLDYQGQLYFDAIARTKEAVEKAIEDYKEETKKVIEGYIAASVSADLDNAKKLIRSICPNPEVLSNEERELYRKIFP